jgi:ATP-binding cassette, subfamily B, bacterial PglK
MNFPKVLLGKLKKLWFYIPNDKQKHLIKVFFLMILSSLLEVISVGSILPFLGVLTTPDLLYQNELMQSFIKILDIRSSEELILPVTILFVTAILLAAGVRLLLLHSMTKISFLIGASLGLDMYRKTLYQNFLTHIERNSSMVISGLTNKLNAVIGRILIKILILSSSVAIVIGMSLLLFIINPVVTAISFIFFLAMYWIVAIYTRYKLSLNDAVISKNSNEIIQVIQEGLGSVRDILVNGNQKKYYQRYNELDLPMRKAMGGNLFIEGGPRFIMEALGMILIAVLAYIITQNGSDSIASFIPMLGVLALGAQRLLPAFQQIYGSYSSIKGSQSQLDDVLLLLDQRINIENFSTVKTINFNKEIKIQNLSFRYNENKPWVFKGINLTIKKGSCVGIIGKSGSGKSTLVDLIVGLIHPTSGAILIDEESIDSSGVESWCDQISYVSQKVYLIDNSIGENIAFNSKEKGDISLIKKAAKAAHISNLIEGLPDMYDTNIGEEGLMLSGGQRQRIGIARGLYNESSVLIFDEATSALDEKTENNVISEIKKLHGICTIIMISHKLSSLKCCDEILEIDEEGVNKVHFF